MKFLMSDALTILKAILIILAIVFVMGILSGCGEEVQKQWFVLKLYTPQNVLAETKILYLREDSKIGAGSQGMYITHSDTWLSTHKAPIGWRLTMEKKEETQVKSAQN